MYVHGTINYVKDVFPERYLKEPLKTEDVIMVVDGQLKHDILDYSVQGKHLDEIRKIYHDSDRIWDCLWMYTRTSNYNTNQYPFTNMKQGLGLIEIRSNQVDDNNIVFALTTNDSLDKKDTNITS